MKKKKKSKLKKKKQQSLLIPFLLLLVLIGGVLFTSKTILNDIKTSISITNIKEATFNNTNKNDTIITVSNKNITDSDAINSSKKYSFEVYGNQKYQIEIINLSEIEDLKYIKLYLTDDNNQPLNGFKTPKTFAQLVEGENGKILYEGESKIRKLNLRVWIDKKYKGNKSFSYKLIIK